MKRKPARQSGPRKGRKLLEKLNLDAAGIDIGSHTHYVAVPEDRDQQPVRAFNSFTSDLYRLADWLQACRVKTVAMESTGVYWIPLYEILEERGFEVLLVNARHLKGVPGRKTDVLDCQWIQELHTCGLLRGSFRPSQEIAALRTYLRHRERLVSLTATHIQHMQKALAMMNVQLHNVISDITGETGMKIIRAIVAGCHDPYELAEHRNWRCKASVDVIAESLVGNYRPEHLFTLKQAVELYDEYQRKIGDCDCEIESMLRDLQANLPKPAEALPPRRTKRKAQVNEPRFEIRSPLHTIAGADLTQINGIGPYNALRIVSEIGRDMGRWPTRKHFTSWLRLAPGNKVSGGRVLSTRTQPSANRVAHLLRLAAGSVGRTQTALGAFYRRIAARAGKAKAVTATARKLAERIYLVLRTGVVYADPGADAYEVQYRSRLINNVKRRAKSLGFQLVEMATEPGSDLDSAPAGART